MTDFQTWDHAALVKFAIESRDKMVVQNDQIEQLKADLRTAIEAYRLLMRGQATSPGK
jgi:hypothetical protein